MTLNEKLINLRKQAGLSQDALAGQLGVSRQAISKWELGTAMPETKNIIQLAEIFDTSIDELIDYTPADNANDLKSVFKKYSGTLYFVLYEIFTVVYMFALAHISVVIYSIIRHTLRVIPEYGIDWNLRYFRFVVMVNLDNLLVALLALVIGFTITRYIRKKDGGLQ